MPSVAASLALALLSLACWGSWSNASKAAESVSFAVFYLDFSLGVFLVASAGLLLGGGDGGPSLAGGAAVARSNFAAALASGGVFNVANLLLVVAIRSAGLAVAFPVGIGTALVLGTALTYLQDPSGDAVLLGFGVALALGAILAIARAHRAMAQQQQQRQTAVSKAERGAAGAPRAEGASLLGDPAADGAVPRSPVGLCVVAGALMSCWAPLAARARRADDPGQLSAVGTFFVFALAVLLTSPALLCLQRRGIIPRAPGSAAVADEDAGGAGAGDWRARAAGVAGGVVWAVGTLSNLLSGGGIGAALAYAIGQSAPVVATAWGVCYFKEFENAPAEARRDVRAMFALYAGAIVLLAWGGSG